MSATRSRAWVSLVAGVAGISFGSILARLASEAHPIVISAYRVGLAWLVLLPFAWRRARGELRAMSRRDLAWGAVSGAFLALHFTTWIASLQYTAVANSVVLVSMSPLWAALLTPLVARERVGSGVFVCVVLCMAGAAVMCIGDVELRRGALRGDLLALVGSVFGALYLLVGRRLRARFSLLAYVTVCYGSAGTVLWSLVFAGRLLPATGYAGRTLAALIAMGVLSQLVGHTCFNWALKWFQSHVVAVAFLAEPIGATILAYVIFGETLTVAKATGGAVILLGIYLLTAGEKRTRPNTT